MKLILGTAQLGNVYGYSNRTPATTYAQCRDIVHTAYMQGIRFFDTAIAYGRSAEYLSRALQEIEATEANVIHKFGPDGFGDNPALFKVTDLYAILAHGFVPSEPSGDSVSPIRLGASVDLPIEAWMAVENSWVEILQVPYNMQQTDMLRPILAAQKKGIEVMTRSTFMQGKLFDFGCSVEECMNFVHTTLPDCMQVIGAETVEQVEQLCEIAKGWEADHE